MDLRRVTLQTLFILLVEFLSTCQTGLLSPYLVRSFPRVPNATLNHFTVSANGSVYIGAVNSLYHLSRNFDVKSQTNFQNEGDRNVNKILDIVPSPVNNLISCGTGLNGTCQLRSLDDISQDVRYLYPRIVGSNDDSTVGRVIRDASEKISLYVAQTAGKDDRFLRPVSVICLHKGEHDRCDDRATKAIYTSVAPGFIIQYAAVFSYEGYTYFVASQRGDATYSTSTIVPKMSRVCHNDESDTLAGFTEITLECRGENGTLYSIAKSAFEFNGKLYIAFVKNSPENGNDFNDRNQSALCMYDMKSLKREFEASILNCSCNTFYRSHSTYLWGSVCSHVTLPCELVKEYTCFPPPVLNVRYPERSPLFGGLQGLPICEWSGASFSSVILTEIHHPVHTMVALIGTTGGTLFKVRFDAEFRFTGVIYEALEMGYSVLKDTWINPVGDAAMFLTEKQLLEIMIANCSQYATCEDCVKPGSNEGDPHCGWCTLEKRCTRYEDCKNSNISLRWIWYNETRCPSVVDVRPSNLSTDIHSQTVVVTVDHLPVPNAFHYTCHFGSSYTSTATFNNGLLSCLSPGITDIPSIPDGDDSVEITLSISSSELNISFVTTPYAFFSCSRIRQCRDCVSKWPCDWCIDLLLCTYNLSTMCNNITGLKNDAGDYCPILLPGQTVIPSDVNTKITVSARNLNLTSGLLTREYECVIETDGIPRTFIRDASFTTGTNGEYNVTCNNAQYSYSMDNQEVMGYLQLRWRNTGVFLDGVYNVTLYKCHVDRPDCSRCLSNETTSPRFECGWCNSPQGFCGVQESCSSPLLRECYDPPRISSISPESSPIEGGTIVEIHGTDLGQRFSDIFNVSLAGVVCEHRNLSDKYGVGARLTCETGNSSTTRQGEVSLFLLNEMKADYGQFSYTDPYISSFYPMVGPQSGGTLITIRGTDLNTGRDIRVEFGDNNCGVVEHSTTTIVCQNEGLSGKNNTAENRSVSVYFDGHSRNASLPFAYHKDPVITDVTPERTIKSGGNMLTVTGERFFLIQNPKIVFIADGNNATEDCVFQNEMRIICKSPSVQALLGLRMRREESTAEGTVAVGFVMDGVKELLQWSQKNDVVFQYFKDPEYETFDIHDHQKTTYNLLTLYGTDLDLASSIQDVTVYVGTELCQVRSLGLTSLICELPSQQPDAGDLYGGRASRGLPFIIVRHANLELDIGYIRYTTPTDAILRIALPVACVVVIMIIIIVVITVWYIWRDTTQKVRDLELEVRNSEESVNANIKALFATLRSTMPDLEIALREQKRIPSLNQRQYLLNMLFQGLRFAPLASPSEEIVNNPNINEAMEEFSTLINQKHFLKVFITTLDQNTSTSAVDKANVASLLSVCLLLNGNLELYTEILLSLMQEQIKECGNKANERLLFSRNDSLVSNLLSNWTSICLYAFVKDQAASQVYQLYEAIKYVCEMGPIDAVTGKSQFSVNDQQMLERQIDFNEVKIKFTTRSGNRRLLKVLDVSTITQVKDSIISQNYGFLPYSQRPSPFSLDLVCKTGEIGNIILKDDGKLPGNVENGWRKVNTLGDFNVPSNSTFELLPKDDLYATISNEMEGQEDNADYHIYHTYHDGDQVPKNANDAMQCDTSLSKRKSDDVNTEEDTESAKSASTSNLVTAGGDRNAAIDSIEKQRQAEITSYSHHFYHLGGHHYEDVSEETVNVATNADMLQSKENRYDVKVMEGERLWHLIKEDKGDLGDYDVVSEIGSRTNVKGVVLSFLPATMKNIEKFVDNLVNAIFAANVQAEIPPTIKFLFQFFDREAEKQRNPALAKAWKDNVLPLDYWDTIITNPQYVLDVGEYSYTHSCLEIIAQVIKDTCSGHAETHRNKEFSSSRLLYSHFVKEYIPKLENYYLFIGNLGLVDRDDLRQECKKVEQEFKGTFNLIRIQRELFHFIADYQNELTEALEVDNVCRELSHAAWLRRVAEKMN